MEVYSCPCCWTAKRECRRTPDGCCRRCAALIQPGVNDCQASIKYAQPLQIAAVYEQLYKAASPRSLLSLDCEGRNPNTLTICITSSTGSVATAILHIAGLFAPQNHAIVETLDQFIREKFSAPLEAAEGEFPLIANAALIGGYLYLLCSSRGATEHVQISRDGFDIGNEYVGYNLPAHFNYFLICRLRELVDNILGAIRLEDPLDTFSPWCSNAYAAAVISHHEISHFRGGLRNGYLHKCVFSDLKVLLLDWLASVEAELIERIREGCRRFPCWRSPIKGSMRKSRRRPETFTATLQLGLSTFTSNESQSHVGGASPYANLGRGDCMLFEAPDSQPTSVLGCHSQSALSDSENHTYVTQLIPPYQPVLIPPRHPKLTKKYPIVASAPFGSIPSHLPHGRYLDSDPWPGQTIPVATLDPRYLSTIELYSGYLNV